MNTKHRDASTLLLAYVRAHEQGRSLGRWDALAELFSFDGRLVFEGLPLGPFEGRAAVRHAFENEAPTDELLLVGPPTSDGRGSARAPYAWKRTPTTTEGELVATAQGGRLRELRVVKKDTRRRRR